MSGSVLLDSVPKRVSRHGRMEIIERQEDDRLVVQGDHAVYVLGLYAAEVWRMCDGQRTVKSMVEEICRKYGLDFSEVASELQGFLGYLLSKRLLELR